jgi:CheY-like chemotaxis protein
LTTLHDPDESHQNLNILVAEDNPVNRLLALKLLQKQGHVVTSVNNGREALALWKKNQSRQFDISLLDVQMPEMDGLQATSGIREKEVAAGTHIPIIAVPAHAIKGDRERCLAAGMDGYITKPINPVELAEKKPGGLSRCRENSWRFDGSGPAGLSRCRENSCRFRGPDPGRPQRCRTARALRR